MAWNEFQIESSQVLKRERTLDVQKKITVIGRYVHCAGNRNDYWYVKCRDNNLMKWKHQSQKVNQGKCLEREWETDQISIAFQMFSKTIDLILFVAIFHPCFNNCLQVNSLEKSFWFFFLFKKGKKKLFNRKKMTNIHFFLLLVNIFWFLD